MKSISLIAVLSAATSVAAHGYTYKYIIDGKPYPGFNPYAPAKYSDGITQPWPAPTSGKVGAAPPILFRFGYQQLACQGGNKPATQVAPAPAGSKVTFFWNQWPPTHRGPIITWLGDCGGDCKKADATKMNWFKIDEAGLMKGKWASDVFVEQGNKWTIQLPKNIKNGQYIMRHDVINLEDNPKPDGAQFYPQCASIQITGGSGSAKPRARPLNQILVASDQAWKLPTGPKYPVPQSYVIPGGRVDPSLGVVLSSQLNDGSPGIKPKYPNETVDQYVSGGGANGGLASGGAQQQQWGAKGGAPAGQWGNQPARTNQAQNRAPQYQRNGQQAPQRGQQAPQGGQWGQRLVARFDKLLRNETQASGDFY